MDAKSIVADAISVLESPLTAEITSAIAGAAPPPVGTAVIIAAGLAPKLYRMVNSFVEGQIDASRLAQDYQRMLDDGVVTDAIVAHGEALRQGQAT